MEKSRTISTASPGGEAKCPQRLCRPASPARPLDGATCLAVFARLGKELGEATTPREVAVATLAAADELFSWDACLLDFLLEPERRPGEAVKLEAVVRVDTCDGERVEIPGNPEGPLTPISRKVYAEGPQLILRGVEGGEPIPLIRFGSSSRPSASLMYVPMRLGARPVGILSIQSYTPGCYTAEDLQLLCSLGDLCAAALDRTRAVTTLSRTEERYRQFLEQSSDAVALFDSRGTLVELNTRAREFDSAGAPVCSGDRADRLGWLAPVFDSGELLDLLEAEGETHFDLSHRGEDGILRDLSVSVRLLPGGGYQAIAVDVTQSRRERRERDLFTRLGAELGAAETMTQVAHAIRAATEERWAWDAFVLSVRTPSEEMFFSLLNIDTVEGVKQEFPGFPFPLVERTRPLAGGSPLLVNRPLDYDGPAMVAFGSGSPSRSLMFAPIRKGEQLVGVLSLQSYTSGVFTEEDCAVLLRLTDFAGPALERCRAEAALRESQRALSTLMNNLPGMAYRCRLDAGYTMELVSEGCYELTGCRPEDLMEGGSCSYEELIHPDDRARVRAETGEAACAGRGFQMEYRLVTPAGEERWVWEKGEGVYDGSGALVAVEGFIADITERRRSQIEQEVLSRLAYSVTGAATLTDVAERLYEATDELWNWDAFVFSVRTHDGARYESVLQADVIDGQRVRIPGCTRDASTYDSLGGITRGEPYLLNRPPAGEQTGTSLAVFGNGRPAASLLYAPLRLKTTAVGLLSLQSYTPFRFTERDRDMLQRIADSISPAVERCQAERRTAAFSSLGERLSKAVSPHEASRVVAEVADQLLGWDACSISIFSENREVAEVYLSMDVVDGDRKSVINGTRYTTPSPAMLDVLSGGARLILRDKLPEGTALRRFGNSERLSMSLMFVPVRTVSRILGVFTIQSYTPRAYSEQDLETLQALADHCSGALERTRAEAALRESRERMDSVLSSLNDVVWSVCAVSGKTLYANAALARVYGSANGEAPSRDQWLDAVHPEDRNQVRDELWLTGGQLEYRLLRADGEVFWVHERCRVVPDSGGRAIRYDTLITDISKRKRAEEALRHGASHDSLTDLPNRAYFLESLDRAIARSRRSTDYLFALLFLDLDRFKVINDSLGHLAGDRLLVAVARKLLGCIRPGDMVARLGGDEFCILLEGIGGAEDATRVAERIQEELSLPVAMNGHQLILTTSIGIALGSADYTEATEMLRDADTAMYRAKAMGKAQHQIFDQAMHARAVRMLRMESDLRRGLERGEFVLHYQPILSLTGGGVVGFEALVRWNHPEHGLVSPADFIPLAEETGLIVPLGWWVLREAANQTGIWNGVGGSDQPVTVSINLSARQFAQPGFVEALQEILTGSGAPPDSIILEITESVLMENAESIIHQLATLKAMRLELHVDDFGTGYSSLAYLQKFPIDMLKIDRMFVGGLPDNKRNLEIIRAIVTLAHGLGMGVVAEGVESKEQLEILKLIGCECAQGFYMSRPLDAAGATQYLNHAGGLRTAR